MKKLDYKRPFFFKTHARKFLGILACSQSICFFFRHRCTKSHFSLLDLYLRLSGFQSLLQLIHFLYSGVRIPLILRSSLALNLSDVALYYFSTSVRRSFRLCDCWRRQFKPENIRQQQSNRLLFCYVLDTWAPDTYLNWEKTSEKEF